MDSLIKLTIIISVFFISCKSHESETEVITNKIKNNKSSAYRVPSKGECVEIGYKYLHNKFLEIKFLGPLTKEQFPKNIRTPFIFPSQNYIAIIINNSETSTEILTSSPRHITPAKVKYFNNNNNNWNNFIVDQFSKSGWEVIKPHSIDTLVCLIEPFVLCSDSAKFNIAYKSINGSDTICLKTWHVK